ncbi:hypothetical protein [Flavobacterium sp.]|uniref:hypothetical protein n=1 Tax=Flavobacterium sp. TaxID=239 RepID=UPI002622755E|nr:hypothetical protein [Flavobacterium sp.]
MKDMRGIQKATLRQYMRMRYLRMKLAWAEWMEKQSLKLNRRGQYVALGIFVSVSVSCCLLLISGRLNVLNNGVDLQPSPIIKVRTANEELIPPEVYDSVLEVRVQKFRDYMDSLARSPSGLLIRDSILNARPGLLDSLRIAETINSNRKTRTYEK